MNLPMLSCSCGELIIKSDGDTVKIRSKILVMKKSGSYAICKSCNGEVKVPVLPDEDTMKSLTSQPVRLFIKPSK